MLTRSGAMVKPEILKSTDVNIDDICASLSRQCRYAGHTNTLKRDGETVVSSGAFYSVAAHSIVVQHIVMDCIDICESVHVFESGGMRRPRPPHDRRVDNHDPTSLLASFTAISHDFTEAYVTDVPRGLKEMLPNYADIEKNARMSILEYVCANNLAEANVDAHLLDTLMTPHEKSIVGGVDKKICAMVEMPLLMPMFPAEYDQVAPGLIASLIYSLTLEYGIVSRQDIDFVRLAEKIKPMIMSDAPGMYAEQLKYRFIDVCTEISGYTFQ